MVYGSVSIDPKGKRFQMGFVSKLGAYRRCCLGPLLAGTLAHFTISGFEFTDKGISGASLDFDGVLSLELDHRIERVNILRASLNQIQLGSRRSSSPYVQGDCFSISSINTHINPVLCQRCYFS